MNAIILAAGRGERLKPITDHTPKPMVKVNNKPLLAWHLDNLHRAKIGQIVINVCWLKHQIIDYISSLNHHFDIHISDEGNDALETGGGIKKALPMLGKSHFIAISADVFTDFEFNQLPKLENETLVHLVLVKNPKHHPEGDFSISGAQLLLKSNNTPSFTYSGIGLFHPKLFSKSKPNTAFKLAPLIRQAIKLNKATAQIHEGQWCDVGTPKRLDELNRQF